MSYIGRLNGPRKEDIMRRLGNEYFGVSPGELERNVEAEQALTEKGKVTPVYVDENSNPFAVFEKKAGDAALLRAYYFLMDERAALGHDFQTAGLPADKPNLSLDYRVRNGLAIKDCKFDGCDLGEPWGFYVTISRNNTSTAKIIHIDDELSIQSHRHRDEIWYLVDGLMAAYRSDAIVDSEVETAKKEMISYMHETIMQPGDAVHISREGVHSARNLHKNGSTLVEVSLGIADEKDIKRFYDKSGRVKLAGVPDGLTAPEVIEFCRELQKRRQ